MIFYTLDAYWDKTKNTDLGLFLSGMNPFLFKGEGSAIADYYANYCEFIGERVISVENSYELAKEYVSFLDKDYITEAFAWVDSEKWQKGCEKYLKEPYKITE